MTAPVQAGLVVRAARDAGSLLLTLAGAVLVTVALAPLIPIAHPEYTATAVDVARGYSLATFLSVAVALWGAPSLLRQVLR